MIPSTHPRVFLGLLAVLFVAPLPLGSNRDWAWPLVCGALFVLAATLVLGGVGVPRAGRGVLFTLLALAVWIAFQLLGLPPWLDPLAADLALTRNALLKTLGYAALAFLTIVLVRDLVAVRWVIQTLMLAGCLQVAVGLLQWVQAPGGFGPGSFRASGTFVSPNHLAGFLHQVLGLAAGLFLADRERGAEGAFGAQMLRFLTGPGLRVRLLIVALTAGLVMTLSRAGNLAFLSALLAAAGLAAFAMRRVSASLFVFVASVLLLDVAMIGSHYGLERLQQRVEHTTLESEFRDDLLPYHAEMIGDHGLTGVGAGNYPVVVPAYRDERIPARLTHAENDYLEFLIELGVPGSALLLGVLWLALRAQWVWLHDRARPPERGVAFGCLVATLAMLLHALADFNLQIPSNALVFVLVLMVPLGLRAGAEAGD